MEKAPQVKVIATDIQILKEWVFWWCRCVVYMGGTLEKIKLERPIGITY